MSWRHQSSRANVISRDRPKNRRLLCESLEDRRLLNGTTLQHSVAAPALVSNQSSSSSVAQAYGQLPMSFEVNQGQTDAQVMYLTRGSGYTLFLTQDGAVLSLEPSSGKTADPSSTPAAESGVALFMQLEGANPQAAIQGEDLLPGVSNYFIGNDPNQWHTNVPNYGRVAYQDVYPGVELDYYGNQQQLEYDFTVAPGADPQNIRLSFNGAQSVALDAQGDLVLHTTLGDILQHAPVVYQVVGGARQPVAGKFVLLGENQVTFQVGAYNHLLPLVIDPTLSYSTYLGGSGNDEANGIAVDSGGDAYITGTTYSTDFPTTPGAFQTGNVAASLDGTEAFVTKLNASGTALVYSTYLGGSTGAYGSGIVVDSSGDAYVTGGAGANFPTTAGAFQTTPEGFGDAFVTKFNASGTALVYSTYLDGCGGLGIAVDNGGDAYVTGSTGTRFGTGFPTTPGAFQTTSP